MSKEVAKVVAKSEARRNPRNLHEKTRDLALHLPHLSRMGNGACQVRCSHISHSLTPLHRSQS